MNIGRTAGLLILVVALFAAGCEDPLDRGCTLILKVSLQVTVTDSISGQPVSAGVTASMTEGSFTAPLKVGGLPNTFIYGDSYRLGTYVVRVSAPGYRDWQKTGVRIELDKERCHPVFVQLNAKLQRS